MKHRGRNQSEGKGNSSSGRCNGGGVKGGKGKSLMGKPLGELKKKREKHFKEKSGQQI